MKTPANPGDNSERTVGWLLAAILAVAFGLRLWAILVLPKYFDDHYIFNNVDTFLNGSLRPRHSYYGSLSYLPQAIALAVCERIQRWTGGELLRIPGGPFEGYTLAAFRIMRLFILGYALASLWLIYRAGRRMFSPAVGVVAAAVLAAYPQHLRSTAQLKPDMMALMFTALTLYWTAGAVRNPRLSRFLLAGVGVGLATAAKYIGVAAALPLTVWALWSGVRDRRRWAWLVLAGVSSVVTFFVLNPFFGVVFKYGPMLVNFYAHHAKVDQSGRQEVVRGELEFLAFQHGWILGAFLLLGIGLLVRRQWREPGNGEALLPLSLCIGYPVLYAAGMTLFRTHNLLPALAATALICAYAIVCTGQWLSRRHEALRRPAAVLGVCALLGGFLLFRSFDYAYSALVPGTWSAAGRTLTARLADFPTRHVLYEPTQARLPLSGSERQRTAKMAVPSLAALPPAALDLLDAEAFPLSRTEGPQAAFYQSRRQRLAAECVAEIQPRPFRNRGATILLLIHPWKLAGDPIQIALQRSADPQGGLSGLLPPGLAAGQVVSIELIRPGDRFPAMLSLQPGNRMLPAQYAGGRRKKRLVSPRFIYDAGIAGIHVSAPAGAHPNNYQMRLWRWESGCP